MQNLFEFSPLVVGAIPVCLGIVQVVKQAFKNDETASRFSPLASLVIGVGLVFLTGAAWQVAVASGIIVGLAASGLYSGAKATISG